MNQQSSKDLELLKVISVVLLCNLFWGGALEAREYTPSRIHENERETPYPQEFNQPYLNPVPLLVPQKMKQCVVKF